MMDQKGDYCADFINVGCKQVDGLFFADPNGVSQIVLFFIIFKTKYHLCGIDYSQDNGHTEELLIGLSIHCKFEPIAIRSKLKPCLGLELSKLRVGILGCRSLLNYWDKDVINDDKSLEEYAKRGSHQISRRDNSIIIQQIKDISSLSVTYKDRLYIVTKNMKLTLMGSDGLVGIPGAWPKMNHAAYRTILRLSPGLKANPSFIEMFREAMKCQFTDSQIERLKSLQKLQQDIPYRALELGVIQVLNDDPGKMKGGELCMKIVKKNIDGYQESMQRFIGTWGPPLEFIKQYHDMVA